MDDEVGIHDVNVQINVFNVMTESGMTKSMMTSMRTITSLRMMTSMMMMMTSIRMTSMGMMTSMRMT